MSSAAGSDPRAQPQTVGALVIGMSGESLGVVSAVALAPKTLTADWLVVETPEGAVFLPVSAATLDAGNRLVVPYDADTLATAPRVSGPALSDVQAQELLQHYGYRS